MLSPQNETPDLVTLIRQAVALGIEVRFSKGTCERDLRVKFEMPGLTPMPSLSMQLSHRELDNGVLGHGLVNQVMQRQTDIMEMKHGKAGTQRVGL